LRRSQLEDGWVNAMRGARSSYPFFVIFVLLDPKGIVAI
jgi:hypothetical protein